jgi:hypothetical protein
MRLGKIKVRNASNELDAVTPEGEGSLGRYLLRRKFA